HPKTKNISEINSELIELLVANLSRFFVKAYDGESYLMWER
ncbi:MAG: hypothetical protein JWM28_3097, partial [Chitinophagaceae bacterium]|nr:hypothetical protein [Chitinophagaceae bacterium]